MYCSVSFLITGWRNRSAGKTVLSFVSWVDQLALTCGNIEGAWGALGRDGDVKVSAESAETESMMTILLRLSLNFTFCSLSLGTEWIKWRRSVNRLVDLSEQITCELNKGL